MKEIGPSFGLSAPYGVTIHNDQLYWVDAGTDKIQRADLDNSNVTDLVDSSDGLSYPNGLTIHKDQLYWTAVAINKNQRADLDSSNATDLVDQRLARNFYFTKVFASPDQRPTDLYLRLIYFGT